MPSAIWQLQACCAACSVFCAAEPTQLCVNCCKSAAGHQKCLALYMTWGATCLLHHDISTSWTVQSSLQGASGPLRGTTAEADAELEALRNERALLIDKLNNHPDVRKYAGEHST